MLSSCDPELYLSCSYLCIFHLSSGLSYNGHSHRNNYLNRQGIDYCLRIIDFKLIGDIDYLLRGVNFNLLPFYFLIHLNLKLKHSINFHYSFLLSCQASVNIGDSIDYIICKFDLIVVINWLYHCFSLNIYFLVHLTMLLLLYIIQVNDDWRYTFQFFIFSLHLLEMDILI